jgi:hypothetical protein
VLSILLNSDYEYSKSISMGRIVVSYDENKSLPQ